jgi:hypothetical protein
MTRSGPEGTGNKRKKKKRKIMQNTEIERK